MANKALFLDRDGIINVDHGYVYKISDFEFVDGIFDLCRYAIDMGFQLFVITNQAGIAKGYYTKNDFDVLTEWMTQQFLNNDIKINDVYYCPHHPTEGLGEYLKKCKCRKPNPGMLLRANKKHNIDFAHSIFIGDKISDIQAAEAAGIHNKILVASVYKDDKHISAHRVNNIKEAIPFIA